MGRAVAMPKSALIRGAARLVSALTFAGLLNGNALGQSSAHFVISPGSPGSEQRSTGDGRSHSAFVFVGDNSAFKENYVMSRVSDKMSVEVDSRSEKKPPDKDKVRKYLEGYGLQGEQLERAVNLTLAADQKVRGWMKTLRDLDLPDKRLADMANAADHLRLEQFRLEGQLYERRGDADRMGVALDGFAAYLKSQTSD